MTLLIGPMVAVCGVLAAAIVIRGRARSRRNLYASLRADRERRIREAKERALAPVRRTGEAMPVAAAAISPAGKPGVAVAASAPLPAAAAAPAAAPVPVAQRTPPPLPEIPTAHRPYATALDGEPGEPGEPGAGAPPRPMPRLAMTVLSVASLVAALAVVGLGVVLMIEASSH